MRLHLSAVPRLAIFLLGTLLGGTGCLALSPAAREPSVLRPPPEDGLPDCKMAFLGMTPEEWESLARDRCSRNPAGAGCLDLFDRAADRIRWNVDRDEAGGLLVHACEQGHRPSCAAIEVLQTPTLTNTAALAQIACPRPLENEECISAAWLLSYSCNEKKQAVSCLTLADLFTKARQPDPVWANRYMERACKYGGFCPYSEAQAAEPPARQDQAAE